MRGIRAGAKAILPGISSFETMKFMHSYEMINHSKASPTASLKGNPFHEYGIRVAELARPHFILNVVINQKREIAGVFAGDYNKAHLAGCELVAKHALVPLKKPVDMVITSGGGFPLDATFYQISKALICARNILKPGGTIVVACECREGLGSAEFCGIMRSTCDFQEFSAEHGDPKDFVIDQWCAQNIFQAADHAGKIYIYSSGLSGRDIEKMGALKIENLQRTVDALLPTHAETVVVPEGPYVVGKNRLDPVKKTKMAKKTNPNGSHFCSCWLSKSRHFHARLLFLFFAVCDARAGWLLNPAEFHASAHGRTACTDCHDNVTDQSLHPNPLNLDEDPQKSFHGEKCLDCHGDVGDDLDRGIHGSKKIKNRDKYGNCLNCHRRPHQQPLLGKNRPGNYQPRRPVEGQCGACHEKQSSLPPLSEEDATCMKCHQTRNTENPKDVRAINELCFHCHGKGKSQAQVITSANSSL